MSNMLVPPEDDEREVTPKDGLSSWDEVRRLADELEMKVHLARMGARDRWRTIESRLVAIETALVESGRHVTHALANEIDSLRTLLRELRDDVADDN